MPEGERSGGGRRRRRSGGDGGDGGGQGPVVTDVGRGAQQLGQVVVDQGLDGRLGGVHGDVDRRDDASVPTAYARGYRADAGGQVLVGQRPPLRPHLAQ